MRERKQITNLFLPALVTSSFATQPPGLITGLLLIEIGLTFNHPVGITGQIQTLSNISSVIAALLMSIISIRYRHKTLLLIGLTLLAVSALGCSFSASFSFLMAFYALTGIARAMINPMSNALIGDNLPEEKRSGAIGWFQAGTSIAYLVLSPAVGIVSGMGGWRVTFLVLLLPIALLSIIVSYLGIPSEEDPVLVAVNVSPLVGFRRVFSNRSASWCLLGTVLAAASWIGSLAYMMSYFRQSFLLSTLYASILLSGLALSKTFGHLTVSRLIAKFGRKPFTVGSLALLGFLTAAYMITDILSLSLVAVVLSCVFSGYMNSSGASLNLEQVPEYRGSMMSLNVAAFGLGGSLGTGLGGAVLVSFGYDGLGVFLGVLSLTSALIYHYFTIDPTR